MGKKAKTRPGPTQRLINAITGGNKKFLSWVHHGLDEVPFGKVYPFLNLDELIIIAGVSWRARDSKKEKELHQTLGYRDLAESFVDVLEASKKRFYEQFGLDEIRDRIPEELVKKYEKLNSYECDLKDRLSQVSEEDAEALNQALKCQTLRHVFEDQYFAISQSVRQAYCLGDEAEVDPARLKIMRFQIGNKRDRADEKVVRDYVREINRIINGYPQELYVPSEADVLVEANGQKLFFNYSNI